MKKASLREVAERLGAQATGRLEGGKWELWRCPRGQTHHENGDQHASFKIMADESRFYCPVCGLKGRSAATLVMQVLGIESPEAGAWLSEQFPDTKMTKAKRWAPDGKLEDFAWEAAWERFAASDVAQRLWAQRGLSRRACQLMKMGVSEHRGEATCVVPLYGLDGEGNLQIVGRRHRRLNPDRESRFWKNEGRAVKELMPTKASWGPEAEPSGDKMGVFLSWQFGDQAGQAIYVVEGWPDTLAAIAGNRRAIGLPGAQPGERVLRELAKMVEDAPEIVLCPQRDKPSMIGMAAVAQVIGPSRCRVLFPPEGFKDFCEAHEQGRDGFRDGELSDLETLERGAGKALEKVQPVLSVEIRVLRAQMQAVHGDRAVSLCNYDIRVAGQIHKIPILESDAERPELLVDVVPLAGRDLRPRPLGAVTQGEWLEAKLMLEKIHTAWPLAAESELFVKFWPSIRAHAQRQCPETAPVTLRERCGWRGPQCAFPSVVFEKDTWRRESLVDERRMIDHDWDMPLPRERWGLLADAVLDLSAMAAEDHVNAALLGMHLSSALHGRLKGRRVAPASVYLMGATNLGKSYLARAHMLVHTRSTVIASSQAAPGEISLTSTTAKAGLETMAHLADTVVHLDNWNPTAMEARMQEWTRALHALFDGGVQRRLTSQIAERNTPPTGAALLITGEDLPADAAAINRYAQIRLTRAPWDGPGDSRERGKRLLACRERIDRIQAGSDALRALVPTVLAAGVARWGSLEKLESRAIEIHRSWEASLLASGGGRHVDIAAALGMGLDLLGESLLWLMDESQDAQRAFEVAGRFTALGQTLHAHFEKGFTNGMVAHEFQPTLRILEAIEVLCRRGLIAHGSQDDRFHSGEFKFAPGANEDAPLLVWERRSDGKICVVWGAVWKMAREALQRSGEKIAFSQTALRMQFEREGIAEKTDVQVSIPKAHGRARAMLLRPGALGLSFRDDEDLDLDLPDAGDQ